jgi:hypothetical protein
MNEGTSVLLGREDEFAVLQLNRIDVDTVRVVIEVIDREGACPGCGVPSSRVKERPLVRVKHLPASGQRTELWWLKRRLVSRELRCGTGTFTQQSTAVPARARLTSRPREKIGSAIATGNRAVSEVAAEYQVAWATAHRALTALAARWLPEPEPTRVLGIDETRARSVRWVLGPPCKAAATAAVRLPTVRSHTARTRHPGRSCTVPSDTPTRRCMTGCTACTEGPLTSTDARGWKADDPRFELGDHAKLQVSMPRTCGFAVPLRPPVGPILQSGSRRSQPAVRESSARPSWPQGRSPSHPSSQTVRRRKPIPADRRSAV